MASAGTSQRAIEERAAKQRKRCSGHLKRPDAARAFLQACLGAAVCIAALLDCAAAQEAGSSSPPASPPSSSAPSTPPVPSPSSAPPASTPSVAAPNGRSNAAPGASPNAAPNVASGVIHPPATFAPMQPDRRQAKAKTSEEAAAYQKIASEKNADAQIRQIEDFLLQYPDSELREYVFEEAMEAYRAKNDYDHMETYGELTLAQNPDNLTALLELSSSLAESTGREDPDREGKLDDGEEHATHALAVLDQLHKPPGLPDEQWDRAKKEAQSRLHAARGVIALVRQDFAMAVAEMKQAVDLAQRPSAVLLYRLGLGYSFQEKYAEAIEALDRSAAMGGVKLPSGGKVRDLVAEAKEMASKGLASAPAPAEEDPAAAHGPSPASSEAAPDAAPATTPPGNMPNVPPASAQPGSHLSQAGSGQGHTP